MRNKTMALSEDEKNTIREIAREIGAEILVQHVNSCPHGKELAKSKAWVLGLCVGSGIAGGATVMGISRLLVGLFGGV
jgi:hypothetical protein